MCQKKIWKLIELVLLIDKENTELRKSSYNWKKKKKSSTFMVKKAAYKSPQSMGKAITKCLKSLPCSPTKKKAAVSGVTNKSGLKV